MLKKDITIAIFGHFSFVKNPIDNLKLLVYSLGEELRKCKFILIYDRTDNDQTFILKNDELIEYLESSGLNYELCYSDYGLHQSVGIALDNIKTDYFLFMEHDFVFLNEKRINFKKLIKSFNKNQFINAVWFNYWENALTIDDYAPNDGTQKATYFGKEEKVKDVDLINTIRFSNRPCLYRTLSYKEWYEKYIKDFNTSKYVDVPFPENSHLGSNGVEETMIKVIREDVHTNDYADIRYKWGLYLYGNIGDSPYVAHIDGSKNKFEGENKTIAEINGEEFLETYSWLL